MVGGEGNDRLNGGAGNDLYVYCPRDGFDIIEDESGIDVLHLQGIFSDDVEVNFVIGGWLCVYYRGQPIVKMRGLEYIQTEDGRFSVVRWLMAS